MLLLVDTLVDQVQLRRMRMQTPEILISLLETTKPADLGAYVLNDVFTIAYDTDAEKVWFGKNGTWGSGCGDPGAGGAGFPLSYANEGYAFVVASASNNGGNDFTITWGGSDYTIPTGFSNF